MKKAWMAAAIATLTVCVGSAAASTIDPLAIHRGTSRVLVVVAPDDADPRVRQQRRSLDEAAAGCRERNLVLLERTGMSPDAAAFRRRFHVPADAFRAVLIGKDGGDKLASSEPIAAARLFAEIDRMPMRREELRREELRRDEMRRDETRRTPR